MTPGLIGWFASRVRRSAQGEQGATLVELMVATAIFAIVMTGALVAFNSAFRLTRDDRMRSVAANLASQTMDSVRAQAQQDFTAIAVGTVATTQTVDGSVYTIFQRDRWITSDPNAGPCDGASGKQLSEMSVRVSVRWTNMYGTRWVTSQTVLTPPAGTYDPETGHIGVLVMDQTGAGVPNIPVLATGSGYSDTEVTQSDGCAFFGFLDPNTYSVSLNSIGYVSDQGLQNPTQSATVVIGTITSMQFNYAQSATLDLTLAGAYGGTVASASAVSVGNTHLLPTGTKSFAGSGSSRSIGNLYPFTDGFQVWGGDCLDADPQAQKTDGSGAFYPGATRQSPIGVQAGLHSSGSVTLASANVTVTRGGVAQAGLTVVAVHTGDTGCPAGEQLTLGVTNAGGVVSAALPYGAWQFTVSGKSPSGSWPKPTLSPLDASAKSVAVAIL